LLRTDSADVGQFENESARRLNPATFYERFAAR
jgi:hypothetical protein